MGFLFYTGGTKTMGTENNGFQQAYVNGQPIQFEDGSSPTVSELRQQGHIPADQLVVRNQGNGSSETLSDETRIQAGETVVSIPQYTWG
jgi:hypothetical protein